MPVSTVIPTNLGTEFDQGSIQGGKIRLKIGSGLSIAPDGTITATGSLTSYADQTGFNRHQIGEYVDENGLIIPVFETQTQLNIAPGTDSLIYLKENGSDLIDLSPYRQTLSTTTETVDKTFSEGVVVNTGTNFNVSTDVITPYLFGASVTPTGTANDTRLYEIRFNAPHPDGDQYAPIVSGISNEPNGDEAKINIIEGSINANGFDVINTVDDNGGTEDPQVFLNFTFRVIEKVEVLSTISIS